MDKKIFISYCWKNYNIVDIIDSDFKSIGITLIRDIRDLKPYESLKEFMKKIREADFVISVISEHYLKSFNCMYEIKELIKDDEYNKKIFPIVIKDENFDIYNSNSDINIITYWEKEYDNHNKKIKKLKSEQNKIEPLERLREI